MSYNNTEFNNLTKYEYQSKDIHTDIMTNNIGEVKKVAIKSPIADKVYNVHLEFAPKSNPNVAEEIRGFLKEKYINEKIGSMQMEPSAVQYHSLGGGDKEDLE